MGLKDDEIRLKRHLELIQQTPRMYASTKEAFLAYVSGFCEGAEFTFPPQPLYAKHLVLQGNALLGCTDPVDDQWAAEVIRDVLDTLL